MADIDDNPYEAVAAYAESIEGVTAHDSPDADNDTYSKLVAEWEVEHHDQRDIDAIDNLSGCALIGWAVLEGAGIALPPRGKYKYGAAITNLVGAAKQAKAYIEPSHPDYANLAVRGNQLHLAKNGAHVEHIGTIVGPGVRIDGGQRTDGTNPPAGRETVLRKNQALVRRGAYWMELGTGRLVAGIIDVRRMYAYWNSGEEAPQEA